MTETFVTRSQAMAQMLRDAGLDYLSTPAMDTLVTMVLRESDDRVLYTQNDFARRIGRSPNTLITWRNRGQHSIPSPSGCLGPDGDGAPYWDQEDIEAWCATHLPLVRTVDQ